MAWAIKNNNSAEVLGICDKQHSIPPRKSGGKKGTKCPIDLTRFPLEQTQESILRQFSPADGKFAGEVFTRRMLEFYH